MNKEVKMVTTLKGRSLTPLFPPTHLQERGHGVGPQEDDEELEGELEEGLQGGLAGRHPDVHPHHH